MHRKFLILGAGVLFAVAVVAATSLLGDASQVPALVQQAFQSPELYSAMAVVTKYGAGYKDPSAINNPEAAFAEGRPRVIQSGPVSIANGDSANSKIYVGKIPSNAVPLAGLAVLKHGAHTGLNDLDIGLEKDGATTDIDIFADGLDVTAAGVKDPFASIPVASWGKRVWELLGLATDPGCEYDIVLTMKAAATATASLAFTALYSKK